MNNNSHKQDNLVPVSDSSGNPISGLYKASDTGAIVNANNSEYQKYLAEKQRVQKMQHLESEMCELKGELSDIKNAVNQLIQHFNREV